MLEPYKELFRPGEEVSKHQLIKQESSFENTERRYAWLRRLIREYRDKYMNVFPDEWNMQSMLCYEFCKDTKIHLDEILSQSHSFLDVSVMIKILQKTIDFEQDLHKKFASGGVLGKDFDLADSRV